MTDVAVDGAVTVNGASDQTSTALLYEAHGPAAVRLAYLMTGDAAIAQDMAHDAFLKAATRLHLMRDPERFGSYLRRTVVRTVLMRRRSAEREQGRIEAVARQGLADVGDPASGSVDHLDLIAALRTLPPRQRAVLVLHYWLDLPEAEIARAVGCRPGTVKSTTSRGLDALRKVLPADA